MFSFCFLLILSYSILNQPCVHASDSEYDDPFLWVSEATEHAAKYLQEFIKDSVDPCDNFYEFTCSNMQRAFGLDPDIWKWQMIDDVEQEMEKQIKIDVSNLRTDSSSFLKKLEIFFDNCKKTSEEENKNALLEVINHVGGMPALQGAEWDESEFDWLEMVFKLRNYGFRPKLPLDIFVGFRGLVDHAEDYLINVKPPPFREYCFLEDMVELVTRYGANKQDMHVEMQKVCDFEKKLLQMARAVSDSIFEFRTVKGLEEEPKYKLPWTKIFHNYFFNADMKFDRMTFDENFLMNMYGPYYFEKLADIIKETPKRVVANFITWHALNDATQFLNGEFNAATINQLSKGQREQQCVEVVKKIMPRAVEALYVKNHIADGTRDTANSITENIKNQLIQYIQKADWIQDRLEYDDFKNKFIQKIKKMRYTLGFPVEYMDNEAMVEYYKDFEIVNESLLRTALKTMKYFEIVKLNILKKHKQMSFNLTLFGSNGTHKYSYINNKFELPLIFLHEKLVHPDRPQYLNYGYLGSWMAKYFAHVVDDIGISRDADYHFLTHADSTVQEMSNKENCLKEQYNKYLIKEANRYVNGSKTLTMNMIDNMGFKIAYHAYIDWAKSNNLVEPGLPLMNYTSNQLFWISAASYYCTLYKDKSTLIQNMNYRIESPPEARVMVPFSNLIEFAEDFKCKPGSRMNPIEKCSIL